MPTIHSSDSISSVHWGFDGFPLFGRVRTSVPVGCVLPCSPLGLEFGLVVLSLTALGSEEPEEQRSDKSKVAVRMEA